LIATIQALYNEKYFDDNATACLFPARTRWLTDQLHLKNLPKVTCKEYNKVLHRLDPVSTTIVFPSAHINSPASMFGHTFLRINSSYNSKLLSYAINYAADADSNKENGVIFAIKGLFGGYDGKYSLLPYYEKLKEYQDTENRDIWEYDLNLNIQETKRMFEHIWEVKDTYTTYLFFNRNCSYAMLWLLEVARPSLHLRGDFIYQVSPLETIFTIKKAKLIKSYSFRASSRSQIEAYRSILSYKEIQLAKQLSKNTISLSDFIKDKQIILDKKRYILELAINLLQYDYKQKKITKEYYLQTFHTLTLTRAKMGKTKKIIPKQPDNPLQGHQANRLNIGFETYDNQLATIFSIRPVYHSFEDSPIGFLRGTQIEFFNIELLGSNNGLKIEKATLLSLYSITQIDSIFTPLSWKLQMGWDTNSIEQKTKFNTTIDFGWSLGNNLGYIYILGDLFGYNGAIANIAIGTDIGIVIDKLIKNNNTHFEYIHRFYNNSYQQNIFKLDHNIRIDQNFSVLFQYTYKDKINTNNTQINEEKYRLSFCLYF